MKLLSLFIFIFFSATEFARAVSLEGEFEAAKMIYDVGDAGDAGDADVVDSKYNRGFMASIDDGDHKAIKSFLEKGFFEINGQYHRGLFAETPLFRAIDNNNLKTVKFLIKNGADVKLRSGRYHETPFHSAMFNNLSDPKRGLQIPEFLIKKGADVNAKYEDGITILHLIAFTVNSKNHSHYLENAKFLIKHGADPRIEKNAGLNAIDQFKEHTDRMDARKDKKRLSSSQKQEWRYLFEKALDSQKRNSIKALKNKIEERQKNYDELKSLRSRYNRTKTNAFSKTWAPLWYRIKTGDTKPLYYGAPVALMGAAAWYDYDTFKENNKENKGEVDTKKIHNKFLKWANRAKVSIGMLSFLILLDRLIVYEGKDKVEELDNWYKKYTQTKELLTEKKINEMKVSFFQDPEGYKELISDYESYFKELKRFDTFLKDLKDSIEKDKKKLKKLETASTLVDKL